MSYWNYRVVEKVAFMTSNNDTVRDKRLMVFTMIVTLEHIRIRLNRVSTMKKVTLYQVSKTDQVV